ncbi:MAG: cytochrome P450 [Actinomycetota bacterium]|nr:cytochrome P450 [Actinomycetota bacterium]
MTGCPVAHGYDPLDPSTVLDPHTALRSVREQSAVAYLPEFDHYIVTRYDDIESILLNRDSWSASIASSPLVPVCPAAQAVLDTGYKRVPTLNNADPPRHPKMRKAVLACMTPRRLLALEPVLREAARELVLSMREHDRIDFVDSVAFPFPGFAAFSLLGFPQSDTDQLKAWSGTRVLLTYGRLTEEQQVMVARDIVAMWQYVERYVESRVHDRGDDLTSDLLTYSEQKPDQINQFDIVNMVYSMALAGHETTCNTIGNGVLALLTHRDQWDAMVADRSLIPNAVEEILRFDGPVINHRRLATEDVEIDGIAIAAGSKVMMGFASGDRDPDVFPEPDAFDIRRENAELHLQFGKGAHLCLGIALGRLETRIVLELLAELTPNLELVPGKELKYSANALFRSLQELWVAPNGLGAGAN